MAQPLPISDLPISVRAYNCLLRGGIETTDDLTEKTLDELRAIPNFGVGSALEVVTALNDIGMRLKATPTIQTLQDRIQELETELAEAHAALRFTSEETPA